MRTHRTHQVLAPWSTGTPVLDPARLAAVRIEPVLRQRRPAFALDFYLAGEAGDWVIPGVLVDPAVVVERDRDPLIWPHGMPGDDAFARALAERILPELERLVLSAQPAAEQVVRFAPAPRFDAAREAGCYGAAPLREALVRLAPYRYARRFARGRSVRIDAPDAVGGWLLLRDLATVTVAAARREPAALAWYGPAPLAGDGEAEVAIVAADAPASAPACCGSTPPARPGRGGRPASARPGDRLRPRRRSGPALVRGRGRPGARRAPLPDLTYAAAGGSGGRIAVVLGRADGLTRPDADTDEARALVAALGAEGFEARLVERLDELARADLIHLVGTRDGRRANALVQAGRRAGIPVAVHAHDENAAQGGWWGAAVTRYCFEYGSDERDVRGYLNCSPARGLDRRSAGRGRLRAARRAPDEAAAALRDAPSSSPPGEAELRACARAPAGAVPSWSFRRWCRRPRRPRSGHWSEATRSCWSTRRSGRKATALVARCAAEAGVPLVAHRPGRRRLVPRAGARVRRAGPDRAGGRAGAGPSRPALRVAAAVVVDAGLVGGGRSAPGRRGAGRRASGGRRPAPLRASRHARAR